MNVFELFGKIVVNNDEANRRIGDTNTLAGGLAETFKNGFGAITKGAAFCGKALGTGLAAGAVAMGGLIKSSVGAFAEYEQLVGGVDTLFKDSSGKVQQYATEAYKMQGMSANEYMSTVTGFSASLLQSLKGDTSRAADVSNMALTDMADNANKMGTDMSLIQNAYQGFAQGNYTMLNNLKLGYGGTQKEMKRLLKDAQKITGVKYDINNLSDVYEAIHVIQTEMGITGTTAEEASETIAGSVAMTKAAWTNLLIGIASGNQDLSKLVGNFVDSAVTAAKNITKLLPSIAEGVRGLIQGIAPELPGIMQSLLPVILDGAVALISGLIAALPGLLSAIGETLKTAWVDSIWPAIQSSCKLIFGYELPDWATIQAEIDAGVGPIIENFNNASDDFEHFFTDLGTLMSDIGTWISENKPLIIGFFGALGLALLAVNAPLVLLGAAVLLVAANWDAITLAVETALNELDEFFGVTVPEWWNANVVEPVKKAWEDIGEWINNAITDVGDFFTQTIPESFRSLISGIVDLWDNISNAISNAIAKMREFLGMGGMSDISGGLAQFGATAQGMINNPAGLLGDAYQGGKVLQNAMRDGVKSLFGFATGLDFVPYNDMPARLHYGEAVLTKEDAAIWRSSQAGNVGALSVGMEYMTAAIVGAIREMDDNMEAKMAAAFQSMRLDVNNREFARMVKAVT